MSNTIEDFLRTAHTDHGTITCPSCGSPMGLTKEGSYQMILTESARLALNSFVSIQRGYLDGLEKRLRNVNLVPITPPGEQMPFERLKESLKRRKRTITPLGTMEENLAVLAAEYFIHASDLLEMSRLFDAFPRLDCIDDRFLDACEAILLPGLRPPNQFGPLMDLIFSQEETLKVRQAVHEETQIPERLPRILHDVCPTLARYLDVLQERRVTDPTSPLAAHIRQARVLLVIILGHASPAIRDGKTITSDLALHRLFPDGAPYSLPKFTTLHSGTLHNLLCSEVLLSCNEIKLDPDFRRQLATSVPKPNLTPADLVEALYPETVRRPLSDTEALLGTWFREIAKVVDFACARPKPYFGRVGSTETTEEGDDVALARRICGWFPREGETHAVVLLGSPGTGKSYVMTTGLSTFYQVASSAGLVVSPDSAEDQRLLLELQDRNKESRMPGRTPIGQRASIKMSVQIVGDSFPRTHFVFIDIPGELVYAGEHSDGANADVLRILRNARTIVYFFDLSLGSGIRDLITNNKRDSTNWSTLIDNFQRVNREREGGADRDQFVVMTRLFDGLLRQRQASSLKDAETNIVCVIPKADLFVDASSEEGRRRKFLTDYFMHDLLKELPILSPAPHTGAETFPGLRSDGLTPVMDSDPIDVFRKLSDFAEKRLLMIDQVFGDETIGNSGKALKVRIETSLIRYLKMIFEEKRVFLLPVSAAGDAGSRAATMAHGEGDHDEGSESPAPPCQKLTELVFMIPTLLALKMPPKPRPVSAPGIPAPVMAPPPVVSAKPMPVSVAPPIPAPPLVAPPAAPTTTPAPANGNVPSAVPAVAPKPVLSPVSSPVVSQPQPPRPPAPPLPPAPPRPTPAAATPIVPPKPPQKP